MKAFDLIIGIICILVVSFCSVMIQLEREAKDQYIFEDIVYGDIKFGQTAALSGPAEKLGINMRDGILAAFKEVNDKGGITGRKLYLESLDDKYEPANAVLNVRKLINESKIFAFIGSVGTPTTTAVLPIIVKEQVPLIGTFTGVQFLREFDKNYVINLRASYYQEAEKWIKYLIEDINAKKIAVFYQEDSFGQAGLSGVNIALYKKRMSIAALGSYKRNSQEVEDAVKTISKASPDAIICVASYEAAAKFIKIMRKKNINVPIINISFVGSKALTDLLPDDIKDVYITQVVPLPYDKNRPLIRAYQNALYSYDADIKHDFVSLEGYIAGRFVAEVIRNIKGDITRKHFLDTIYDYGQFNIEDLKFNFNYDSNQGIKDVYLTKVVSGVDRLVSVNKISPVGSDTNSHFK